MDATTTNPASTRSAITAPLHWHTGPALGVTILMPPTVTVAVPQTPHDRLLTVPRSVRYVADSGLSDPATAESVKRVSRTSQALYEPSRPVYHARLTFN